MKHILSNCITDYTNAGSMEYKGNIKIDESGIKHIDPNNLFNSLVVINKSNRTY